MENLNKSFLTRQRKTKNPCPGCGLHLDLCICSEIPKLNLKTKLSLVIHRNELKRTTNTGQLALRSLVHSEMHTIGEINKTFHLESILYSDYFNLLFYPSDEAKELDQDFINQIKNQKINPTNKPIHLIVPDGNWRQASKVHYRNKHLLQLQRVKITPTHTNKYFLRTESKPIGMATLEAIALALGVIEGDSVKDSLLRLYNLKLNKTLTSRGLGQPATSLIKDKNGAST
jgi:DTW domain-containing protein YfiP